MQKINTFHEVLQYLKDQEIILTRDRTSFYLEDNHIVVHGRNSRYKISFQDFQKLFSSEEFYLYQPSSDGIDDEKDDAYYAWKSRGVN